MPPDTRDDAEARAARARDAMVREQIESRGVRDARVLAALRAVPRHAFVPPAQRNAAYEDRPLPIGGGQTISQPYIVARMTEALGLRGRERVLEIGTGCGYQTAVLASLAAAVYSVEIDAALVAEAGAKLAALGVANVHLRQGDGAHGWPEAAPFAAVLIAAAAPHVPAALLDQVAVGGRIVVPVGDGDMQELVLLERDAAGWRRRRLGAVRFVPMLGAVRQEET
jgi:protein-L-isoaspartate(D-aspartate) O-methyltransferase